MVIIAHPHLDLPSEDGCSCVLTTWGMPASEAARRVDQIGLADTGVRAEVIGDARGEVRVLLFAADRDRLDWSAALVRTRLGDNVLGGEGATLEGCVVELLLRQGLTASVADSVTGGMVAERLSEPSSAAEVFPGGLVCPSPATPLPDFDGGEAPLHGTDTAAAGAGRTASAFEVEVDVVLALTEAIGPRAPDAAAEGAVVIGSWLDGERRTVELSLRGRRDATQARAAAHALDHLRRRLIERERHLLGRG